MQTRSFGAVLLSIMLLLVPVFALSQGVQETRILTVNAQTEPVTVIQINGKPYADLEGLARAVNGLLGFKGNEITLTVPGTPSNVATATSSASPSANPGLSSGFLRAGIEAISVVREWRSALANAIQNGFPLAQGWLSNYHDQAASALRLASVAGSSDSDQKAFRLLTNEFNNMDKLSNQYVAARKSLTFIAPDALKNDPLDQKIRRCGQALAAMAASRQFEDDGSCQ